MERVQRENGEFVKGAEGVLVPADLEKSGQYMHDARGALVPVSVIAPIDLMRDKVVRQIARSVEVLTRQISATKASTFRRADQFIARSLEEHGIRQGGKKGNVSLTTFDGEYKVNIDIQDVLTFDEKLKAAKELIDRCIMRWSKGVDNNLKVLVADAFKVDKRGKLDTRRILELRRYEIDDEDWKEAMEAIGKSIKVLMSKRYLRVYKRRPDGEGYKMIPLDFSSAPAGDGSADA